MFLLLILNMYCRVGKYCTIQVNKSMLVLSGVIGHFPGLCFFLKDSKPSYKSISRNVRLILYHKLQTELEIIMIHIKIEL